MSKKTYKREAAGFSLLGVFSTAFAAIFFDSDTAVRVLEIIAAPITTFSTAMFGVDWMGKQSKWAPPNDMEGE